MLKLPPKLVAINAALATWNITKQSLADTKSVISVLREAYDQALGQPAPQATIVEARRKYRAAQAEYTRLLAVSGKCKREVEALRHA